MKVFIDSGAGPVDYTSYVVDGSLSIEDSVNVPTVTTFNLVATNAVFQVPKRSSYIRIVSEVYSKTGGYLQHGQTPYADGKVLTTGWITTECERQYLGLNKNIGYNLSKFQQFVYVVKVTSDEWLINTKFVPFIPAFVNQTQGQILANLANALVPGFFNVTSFVASGDLVPYYEYQPEQTWGDIAKTFADSTRYRYQVIDRVLYFQPFGDKPLGMSYNEVTQNESQLSPLDLSTQVVTVPPVNDALVLGQIEPQDQWDNYFVGDGFTSNFQLLYSSFNGSSVILQSDDWTETQFDTSQWNVQDPFGVFALAGELNVLQAGLPSPALGVSYIVSQNGIEIGGALNLQAGEFEFTDTCTGIVGGVYTDSSLLQSTCFAGFNLTVTGSVVVTASGAGGIIMQPMLFGVPMGPKVVSQPNHHYQLQIWIGGNRFARYNSIYRNFDGTTQYGGNALASFGQVTFVIGDVDEGVVIGNAYGPQSLGAPVPVVPALTKFTVANVNCPEFGIYAIVNGINLNLAVNYTVLAQPPQGVLNVQSLSSAPSGGLLPILPQNLSPYQHYLLGTGFENQTATIGQGGETDQLQFYNDTIPGVGSRIRFTSWADGTAMARVNNPAAILQEACVSGDNGIRSAIFTNLNPPPRTSDECELAAGAAILDRAFPQFQGNYQVFTVPFYFENLFSASGSDYPRSGRFFFVNAPTRAVSGQNFFVNTARIQVIELKQEILQLSVDYGPDLYLEKMLQNFVERTDNLLTDKETQVAPTPIQLESVGNFFLPPFVNPQVTLISNSLTGFFVTFDLGGTPITAAEVRRVDGGWGVSDSNLVGRFTTQQFTVARTARDQHWFIRPVNGGQTSRFSWVPRIVYPLIPSPPAFVNLTDTNLVLTYNGDVRDIYGVELRLPAVSGEFIINVPINQPPPAPGGTQPPPPNTFPVLLTEPVQAYFFNTPGANGTAPFVFPVNPATAAHTTVVNSLMFNSQATSGEFDPNVQPMENAVLNTKGQTISTTTPWFGANENYGMILVGTFIVIAPGTVQFQIDHDDGMYWAIQGATLVSQSPVYNDPFGHIKTPINGYQFTGGNVGANNVHAEGNAGNAWQDVYTVSFAASGAYNFEIAYVNWTSNQMLTVRANTVVIPPNDGTELGVSPVYTIETLTRVAATPTANTTATCTPSLNGVVTSPINIGDILLTTCPTNASFGGLKLVTQALVNYPTNTQIRWYDFGAPFPVTVGNGIAPIGTLQLYQRGIWVPSASGSVTNGVASLSTQVEHGMNAGDVILVGTDWSVGTPAGITSQDAAFYTGQWAVVAVPDPFTIQFKVRDSDPQNFGAQQLSGIVAQLIAAGSTAAPPATSIQYTVNANGILIQRPVFAPSDMVFDLTDPAIQQLLDIAQALNPSGTANIFAYFFNLTWDYSLPLSIGNVSAPTISGLTVDPVTQNAHWIVTSGQPLGYRVQTLDPTTGVTYNRFTVDNPENPEKLTQFQMSQNDFYNDRIITVTPFTSAGDGPPIAVFNPAGGIIPPGGAPNTNSYSIGCTWSGGIPAGQILVMLPLDQQIFFAQNMYPSQGYMTGTATSTFVLPVTLNSQQVGTMTFVPGSTRAVFSSSGFTVGISDVLMVTAPLVSDATASTIGFVLSATKSLTTLNIPMSLVLSDDGSGNWADSASTTLAINSTFTENLHDSFTISDSMSLTIVSSQLQEVLSDTLTITDAFTKNLTNNVLTLNLSDTMSLSDSVALKLPVLVQKASGTSTAVFGSNVKVGNALIVAMGNSGSTVSSVTDTLGNTYVQVSGVASTATGPLATDIWWCASSVGGGANTVTVTWAAASSPSCQAFEVSGLTGSVDVSGKVTNGSGVGTGVSLVGTANYDFYVEMCYPTHSVASISSPWTLTTVQNGGAAGYLVAGGTQQPTFTFNTGSNFPISAAAFK